MKKNYLIVGRSIKEECKTIVLRLFLFLISTTVLCQSKATSKIIADSLFNIAKENIKKGNFNIASKNIEKSLVISEKNNDNTAIGNCNSKIATIHYYKGNYYKALFYFTKSITYFKKTNYLKGISSSTNNIGAIYYYLGNYSEALDFYKKALKLQEQLGYKNQIAGTTKNIGGIYLELNDFENAMKSFQSAKEIYENTQDKKNLSQVLTAIGETYSREKKYSEALIFFNDALVLAKKSQDKKKLLEVFFDIGKLHYEKGEHTKAINYLNKTLKASKEINSLIYQSNSLIALGKVNFKLHKINDAIKKCKEGLKIAKKLKTISNQEAACKCLYSSYKSINKTRNALVYFEQMHLLKDSLNLKQTANKILNMKFEKQLLLDSISHVDKERKLQVKHQKEVNKKEQQRNVFIASVLFILVFAIGLWNRLRYTKKSKAVLQIEKDRSEHLLLNILPEEIAQELKVKGYVDAQDFEKATILFTDFKSFTETASKLSPQELVEEINVCFKAFDAIMETYNIEKIKTIGDAYMAAGGLPKPSVNSVKKTIFAGLEMQAFIVKRKLENDAQNKPAFEMRVGIHLGPIVAGIVGVKKFQYDIWGDTVNTASRMESNGKVGKVNISQDVYEFIKDDKEFSFEYRGKIEVKGKGELEMYFVSLKS